MVVCTLQDCAKELRVDLKLVWMDPDKKYTSLLKIGSDKLLCSSLKDDQEVNQMKSTTSALTDQLILITTNL